VPEEARGDIGYIFSRAQWLRREGKATEAAELLLSVANDPTQALVDRAAICLPNAARPWRCQDRVSRREWRPRAEPGELSSSAAVHFRLDCAAIPR
jgi:hypothetical protein